MPKKLWFAAGSWPIATLGAQSWPKVDKEAMEQKTPMATTSNGRHTSFSTSPTLHVVDDLQLIR